MKEEAARARGKEGGEKGRKVRGWCARGGRRESWRRRKRG